ARRREADSTEAKKAGKVREKTSKPKAEKPGSGKVRNPYRFAKLEESIMEHEERIAAIQAEMLTESTWRDAAKFKALQAELREREAELERMNEEWANW
ncbi:MAG: hypothetical protein ABFS86_19690, partial [Planctomycetota bacterium]